MYASIFTVALAALAPSANPAPTWITDYRQARELGVREHKPLVVVIGSEGSSWAKLAKATEADASLGVTLRDKFVCLSVDPTSEAGQKLAKAFEMDGPGLVISDRTGEFQAYRNAGELPADQVVRTLLSNTGTVVESRKVTTAATTAPFAGSVVVPGAGMGAPVGMGAPPGTLVAPNAVPYQQFAPQQQFYPGMGRGSCPNCR